MEVRKKDILNRKKAPIIKCFKWIHIPEKLLFCPFASEYRQGDITIGDYWGIELVHPEYLKNMEVK